MKKCFKNTVLLLAVLAMIFCSALQVQDAQAATPKLNKSKVTLAKGGQVKLKVTGTNKKVKWSTDKRKVATVTSSGLVKAKSKGTAKITAKIGKKKLVCRVTVEAPKLSKTSLTVDVGKKAALKLTGTEGKVKWYTTDKSVATVTPKGIVRGIEAGNCRVYAKVRGKPFLCVVTVKRYINQDSNPTVAPTPPVQNEFNENDAKRNLSYEGHRTEKGVVVIVKNNYRFDINLDMDCLYYNSKGVLIGKSSDSCYILESGREAALFVSNPTDESYHDVDYQRYEVVFSCKKATAIGNANNIACTSNFGSGNVMVSVGNNGERVAYTVVSVVYYKDGNVVGYSQRFADVDNPGAVDYLEYSFPYDAQYQTIVPDNFKVFVNESYRYSWQ